MITCTVCGEGNEDLAITCTKCHSFLQAKVDNIDLFPAIWGLIESPGRTLKRIVLSKHKNYVVVLLMLLGMALTLGLFSYCKLGQRFPYGALIGVGVLGGALIGIIVGFASTYLVRLCIKPLGGKSNTRNLRAVLAFACTPIVFLLVIIYPVEFGIFGKFLFDHNPPPEVYEPTLHYMLLTLNLLGVVWALMLYGLGVAIASSISWWKGMIPVLILFALLIGAAVALRGL